jgi:hypothetical protein
VEDGEDRTEEDGDCAARHRNKDAGEELCAEDGPPIATTEGKCSANRLGSPEALEHQDRYGKARGHREPDHCHEGRNTKDHRE